MKLSSNLFDGRGASFSAWVKKEGTFVTGSCLVAARCPLPGECGCAFSPCRLSGPLGLGGCFCADPGGAGRALWWSGSWACSVHTRAAWCTAWW
jgi:hypothetical protein